MQPESLQVQLEHRGSLLVNYDNLYYLFMIQGQTVGEFLTSLLMLYVITLVLYEISVKTQRVKYCLF